MVVPRSTRSTRRCGEAEGPRHDERSDRDTDGIACAKA